MIPRQGNARPVEATAAMHTDQILPFAELLKHFRIDAGLTQEALAERAGISARAVSDLERRTNRLPRGSTVHLPAGALGLTGRQRDAFLAAALVTPPLSDLPEPAGRPDIPLLPA
jgi:transcriptional regulator with XRE-family HTH domain